MLGWLRSWFLGRASANADRASHQRCDPPIGSLPTDDDPLAALKRLLDELDAERSASTLDPLARPSTVRLAVRDASGRPGSFPRPASCWPQARSSRLESFDKRALVKESRSRRHRTTSSRSSHRPCGITGAPPRCETCGFRPEVTRRRCDRYSDRLFFTVAE